MRTFNDDDMKDLNGWLAARGEAPMKREDLPGEGWIEPGVGCGFMIRTDCSIAFIHDLVTNPAVSMKLRYNTLEGIRLACEKRARELGFRHLMGWSHQGSVIRRALKTGFFPAGTVTLIAKEL